MSNEYFQLTERRNSEYLKEQMNSLLLKYILQKKDSLIFIPSSFFPYKEITPKLESLIKLTEGFDDTRKIRFKYDALNSMEASNHELGQLVKTYIKSCRKAKKKILVIYSPEVDILNTVSLIETISNEMNYKMLKLDELENSKAQTFTKMSEALQTRRINSVKHDISERLMIVDKVLSNDKFQCDRLFPDSDSEADAEAELKETKTTKAASKTNKGKKSVARKTTKNSSSDVNITVNISVDNNANKAQIS